MRIFVDYENSYEYLSKSFEKVENKNRTKI